MWMPSFSEGGMHCRSGHWVVVDGSRTRMQVGGEDAKAEGGPLLSLG